MKEPKITKENVETLYHNKYLKLYGMHLENDLFYLEASRREPEDLVIFKSENEYENMSPDAVTCVLILKTPDAEPRLYMEHEFRYPAGHFLLSPPAGLIDPGDGTGDEALLRAAKREIHEETGVTVKDSDDIYVASSLFFSSPGMTDESNAIVCAKVNLDDLSSLTNDGAEGTECFDGYSLLTKEEAKELIRSGKDKEGRYFSIFTWALLLYFVYET